MIFGRKKLIKNFKFDIQLDGIEIARVATTKFLGIYIDDKLSWNNQIANLSKRVAINVNILNKAVPKLNATASLMLYYAIIQSHLSYCTIVWGGTSNKNIELLLRLQKKALRIITRSKYREHASPLFKNLRLLKMKDLYKIQIALYVHKHIYNHVSFPAQNSSFVKFKEAPNDHDTRNATHRLFVLAYKTDIRGKSISFIGPRTWNSLPINIRCIISPHEFKRKLITYMTSLYEE